MDVQALLGGMLYTKNSTVKIFSVVNMLYDEFGDELMRKPPPIVFTFDVNSRSNFPTTASSKLLTFDISQFFHVNSENINVIIWISDGVDIPYTFYKEIDFSVGKVYKYFVQIDKNMKTRFKLAQTQNYSSVVIQKYDLLGKLGSTLFPEICKGKVFN
jgi:hypothetical protein